MKINYYKSIGIHQYKDNYLVLFNRLQFGEKSLFETLNGYSYAKTCEIIEKLRLHVNNKIDLIEEFELESNISTIRIFQKTTIVSDELWGKPDIQLDTETILELMLERKALMSSWTREKLHSEVKIMFYKLSESKNSFRCDSHYMHFKVPTSNPQIFFDVSSNQEELISPNDLSRFIKIQEECFNFSD